ncbi:MAG: hypothetical protein ACI841_003353 [Planctomycetota bacterium]|jgi:hypothetical protein
MTNTGAAVIFEGAWDPAVERLFDSTDPPAEIVQLKRPSSASIDVGLSYGNSTAIDAATVVLVTRKVFDASYSDVREGDRIGRREQKTVQGTAHFDEISPKADLMLVAYVPEENGRVAERVLAPEAGETIKVELGFDARDVVLVGELGLGEDAILKH